MMQEWIDTAKELPEKYKPVIICREKEKGKWLVEQGCLEVGGWWRVYGTRCKKVAYWMPMPEPPGKEPDE